MFTTYSCIQASSKQLSACLAGVVFPLKEATRKAEAKNLQDAIGKAPAAQEAAMRNVPHMKTKQEELHTGRDLLARGCRRFPVDVDTDVASHDWANWTLYLSIKRAFLNCIGAGSSCQAGSQTHAALSRSMLKTTSTKCLRPTLLSYNVLKGRSKRLTSPDGIGPTQRRSGRSRRAMEGVVPIANGRSIHGNHGEARARRLMKYKHADRSNCGQQGDLRGTSSSTPVVWNETWKQ